MFAQETDAILVLVVMLLVDCVTLMICLIIHGTMAMLDPIERKIIIILFVLIIKIFIFTYNAQFREITLAACNTWRSIVFNITLHTVHASMTCTASCLLEKMFQV